MARVSFLSAAVLLVGHCTRQSQSQSQRQSHGGVAPNDHACNSFPAKATPAVVAQTCEEFCSGRCDFRNTTAGEKGKGTVLDLYRVTPRNVTGLLDKNTGSAAGDLTFRYSVTLGGEGTFLNGDNVVGRFRVEVDGQYGPYKQCNPKYGLDTREWFCENDCETPPHCNATTWENTSSHFTGVYCECPRANVTVGRINMGAADTRYTKDAHVPGWPQECGMAFTPLPTGACFTGDAAKTFTAATPERMQALLCTACESDVKCDGWAMEANSTTGHIYHHGFQNNTGTKSCSGASRGIPDWISIGGDWYSTPSAGECKGAARPGDGSGCTWTLAGQPLPKYINESCLDNHVDDVVHTAGQECFKDCGANAPHNGTCWIRCYFRTVEGDPYKNTPPLSRSKLVDAWTRAFDEDDITKGGCPAEPV